MPKTESPKSLPAARTSDRQPTIKDVARAADVSTVTVSRVVNEPSLVQAATRDRVERAMRKLGYLPNMAARSMRTNSTRSIGCLVPDLISYSHAAIAQNAEQRLAEEGYSLLLTNSNYDPAREVRAVEMLRTRQVDGLLLYLSDETDPLLHEQIAKLNVPYVILDRTLPLASDIVFSDHASAMRKAVLYLVSLGHRRITLILSTLKMRPTFERRSGFEAAINECGLDFTEQQVVEIAPAEFSNIQVAQPIFDRDIKPTAVICEGRFVRSVLAIARSRNIDIPKDLSLIGIDASELALATSPELTRIVRDFAEIGRTAADLILRRLAARDAPVREITLRSNVVLGGSCAPPRIFTPQ